MKVKVIERYGWKVQISQGHQYFTLDYHGTKNDCLWMARMFRKALKKHNERIIQLCNKTP